MDNVNGINRLQATYNVDNNVVVCQAYVSHDGHTKIALITPHDAWTKELVITAPGTFGYQLKCGDHNGSQMSGSNSNNKRSVVDLGVIHGHGGMAIQFLKAKTFGIMTNYGTLQLPSFNKGYDIVFFWPNDAAGDNWNDFINIMNQAKHVTDIETGIANNVVQNIQDAGQIAAIFK